MVQEHIAQGLRFIVDIIQNVVNWLIRFEEENSDFLPDFKHNILGGISWVVSINVAVSIGSYFLEQDIVPTKVVWWAAIGLGIFAIFLLLAYIIEESYHKLTIPEYNK